ncbi:polyhydroxyalkanoate depolymerase [Litorivicinus lipolyticus]|nr:polyhydroxyalkanoate depolymerase [Litorivicinus lipolyticus]
MLYQAQDMLARFLAPGNFVVSSMRKSMSNPFSPAHYMPGSRLMRAQLELLERQTANYPKPDWDLGVATRVVLSHDYCDLIEFESDLSADAPRVLMVAPLSGHWATLLRSTVAEFLPDHRVYITDWKNTRDVPVSVGGFHLDDYVDYLLTFSEAIAAPVHVVAVCQPSVPVLMMAAVQAMQGRDQHVASITLMGGPIDTRLSPTEVNDYAANRDLEWFEKNVVKTVPWRFAGAGQKVYPGFIQLSGFMAMNFDNHMSKHFKFFDDLINGDGDSAEKHRQFYDEYLAVMDLPADYYLETLDRVFIQHLLPKNKMTWRGQAIDMTAIVRPALMTIEGELDDITGFGQTKAAQDLLAGIDESRKLHWLQHGVGHYGIFNGRKFRDVIAPKIKDFMASSI